MRGYLRDGCIDGDGQSGGLPLRIAVLQAADREAVLPEQSNGFEREDTIRAAAVCDDLTTFRQPSQLPCQLAQRDVDGLRQMPSHKLIFGAYVDDGDQPILESTSQLLAGDRLQRVTLVKVTAQDVADFRPIALADAVQRCDQIEYCRITQTVENVLAVAARSQQPRVAHQPKMLGGVGDRQSSPFRERFDAPFALGEQLQDFQSMAMAECFRHLRELRVKDLLRTIS